MRFLWGQSETDMAHRFFITHTVLLPGLIVSLLAVHYFMVRKYSIEVLVGEMNLAPLIIGALLVFASIFPMPLGQKYDPMNPPTVLQPEWFFMGLYQFIKTQNVQPIHGVLITIALGFFIVSVPFVERDAEHHSLRRAFFNAAAAFIIVEFLALTIYGYLSPGRVGTFTDSQFTDAFAITNIAALASAGLTLAYSQRHRCPQGSAVPVDRLHPRSRTVSEGIISLATGLVLLESFLAYEAILAHASGSQRTFGILSGLVFFCLAGLLYVASALLASQSKR
jgi:quinol-cytochrome oxidoreductase complex cytochrome b subunit